MLYIKKKKKLFKIIFNFFRRTKKTMRGLILKLINVKINIKI